MAKYVSKSDAIAKLQKYCAYQDRCHQEVRNKLLSIGIYGDDLEEVIVELVQEDYLNEERFARSYARGKFRIKQWGRVRIKQELQQRQISDYCIRKALSEIDPDTYQQVLQEYLQKEAKLLISRGVNGYQLRQKLFQRAVRKGYEIELFNVTVNDILESE